MAKPLAQPFPLEIVDDAAAYRRHFELTSSSLQSRWQMMLERMLPADDEGCVISTYGPQSNGYVQVSFGPHDRRIRVVQHRLVWARENKEWPPVDLLVLHSCDRRLCCAPEHLRLGTAKDNITDMDERGRRRIGRKLTPEQSQLVGELSQQGHSLKTISLALGIDRGTASRHIRLQHAA